MVLETSTLHILVGQHPHLLYFTGAQALAGPTPHPSLVSSITSLFLFSPNSHNQHSHIQYPPTPTSAVTLLSNILGGCEEATITLT